MLFAGGLLPVLECHALPADEMPAYLAEPPRRAAAGPHRRAPSSSTAWPTPAPAPCAPTAASSSCSTTRPAARAPRVLSEAEADASPPFARVRALGDDLQAGLLALLFEDYELERLVRDYLIF